MWNYMGWDNASTVAQEVENPQRNYPRAMIAATALVAVTYILPLAAMALAGLRRGSFSTGDWTTAAPALGGPLLGLAVVAGGAITGIGMFNALVMSYSRLPMAMAEEGMLPRVVARRNSRGVPWVSVLLCGLAWALALKLPFERLISIDLILYGSSLLLEFVALVVLRVREPYLERPFKAGNFARRLPAGTWSGGLDRLRAVCLARRKDCRQHLGFAVRLWGQPAGAGALLGYGPAALPPPPGRGSARRRLTQPGRTVPFPSVSSAQNGLPRAHLREANLLLCAHLQGVSAAVLIPPPALPCFP